MIPAIPPLQPCHQMKKLILGWFPQKLLVFHCRKLLEIKCRKLLVFTCRLQEDWVFANEDVLKEKRAKLIEQKNLFVDIVCNGGENKDLISLKEDLKVSNSVNTEKLSAKLLFEITRNTGFETSKGMIGDCFIVDCCDWMEREDDDICGLDHRRISAETKVREIFENSVLKDSFARAGL